jgi:phospholipid N-methyltransferase
VRLKERLAFWRQSQDQFESTGAIQPSSRFLARAMTEPLRQERGAGPVRVVEMGPGTGAVTRVIAGALQPGDHLDCVEINPEFARYLRGLIETDSRFANARDQIAVHIGDASSIELTGRVDFVICSVPLNNLPVDAATSILEAGVKLLDGDGWFTYFEYVGLPRLRKLAAPAHERERLDGVRAAKNEFRAGRAAARIVWRNLPPARAVHVHVGAGASR